jgi:hypothetical protein
MDEVHRYLDGYERNPKKLRKPLPALAPSV